MPFFSIIIPAYNLEKYIHKAINSIIKQSFQDFELIIINDCSNDNTLKIINYYKQKYANIIIIDHLENKTQHIARTNGVEISKGKYILFLDGDDYFSDNAFYILYNEIHKNPGYDFYEFGYIRKPSNKLIFPKYFGKNRFIDYFSDDKYPTHTIWNKAYDSNILKTAFLSMEKVGIKQGVEDIYESIVISYYSKNTYNIKKIIINYLVGTGVSTKYKNYYKTIEYLCSLNQIFYYLEKFIINMNINIKLDKIKERFLIHTIDFYFITQKNKMDIAKLFHTLTDYFQIEIILNVFSYYIMKNYYLNKNKLYKTLKYFFKLFND